MPLSEQWKKEDIEWVTLPSNGEPQLLDELFTAGGTDADGNCWDGQAADTEEKG